MFLDRNRLIVQSDGDPGDQLGRSGDWFALKTGIQPEPPFFSDAVNFLCPKTGIWLRDLKALPNDTSRDQDDPMIIAHGEQGRQDNLWPHFIAHLKRGFLYQNDDLPMLTTPSLYIRAFRWWWLYPLLLVFDAGFLFCWTSNLNEKNPDTVDDVNLVLRFIQALIKYPTPWSWMGRRLYSRTRPLNDGNIKLGEKNPVMGAIAWYFDPHGMGNPEIGEAFRPYIEKYFQP